jgi:hypothetical protein
MQKTLISKRLLITILGVLSNLFVLAQQYNGALRVYTFDAFSGSPVSSANLVLKHKGDTTIKNMSVDGHYYSDSLPIGLYSISISHVGYETISLSNVELITGKSKELRINLMPKLITMSEITVTAQKDAFKPKNELILVSSKNFDFSLSNKLPMSIGDPARIAQNMAGVANNNDFLNNIIVRGNSPRYVQWNINGLEMPTPNHFAFSVGGGGVISMLSANSLSEADFITGAFPAEYGNALSGVFDIRLRKGSQFSHESSVQLGMLGVEASTEGPFSKNSNKTYIVNYRYANYDFLKKLNLIDGSIVPQYQDLTLNFNFPTKKLGTFSFFSINGNNSLLFGQGGFPAKNNVLLNTTGIQHKYFFNADKSLETSMVYSGSKNQLQTGPDDFYVYPQIEKYFLNSILLAAKYNWKISPKHLVRLGVYYKSTGLEDFLLIHQKNKIIYEPNNSYHIVPYDTISTYYNAFQGQSIRSFVSYKLHLHNTTVILGLHSTYFNKAKEITIEPRLGFSYVYINHEFSLGAGLHSFIEELLSYKRYTTSLEPLKLTKAWHIVAGYKYRINENCQIKIEPYFQYLFDVPGYDEKNDKRSLLNIESLLAARSTLFINSGYGKNYGVELSFERSFSKNYFFNFYASRYESKSIVYNVENNTLSNGKYSIVSIIGKDFLVGKYRKIGLNLSIKYYGGMYFDKTKTASPSEYNYYAYHPTYEKLNDYFRTDFQLYYSQSQKRFSYKISLDIFNFTNRLNELGRYYDNTYKSVQSYYQLGRIPILSCKVNF